MTIHWLKMRRGRKYHAIEQPSGSHTMALCRRYPAGTLLRSGWDRSQYGVEEDAKRPAQARACPQCWALAPEPAGAPA